MRGELNLYSVLLVLLIFVSITSSLSVLFNLDVIESDLPSEKSIRDVKFTDLINPFHNNFFLKILWRASKVSTSYLIVNSIIVSIVIVMIILILRDIVRIIRGA